MLTFGSRTGKKKRKKQTKTAVNQPFKYYCKKKSNERRNIITMNAPFLLKIV